MIRVLFCKLSGYPLLVDILRTCTWQSCPHRLWELPFFRKSWFLQLEMVDPNANYVGVPVDVVVPILYFSFELCPPAAEGILEICATLLAVDFERRNWPFMFLPWQEFARIRVNAKANREHAELLQHFSRGEERKSFMDDGALLSGQQDLLREQEAINRTTGQVIIGIS